MDQSEKIKKIYSDLVNAKSVYEDAVSKVASAKVRETEALNRLNDCQKKFDLVVREVKKDAPGNSIWRKLDRAGAERFS